MALASSRISFGLVQSWDPRSQIEDDGWCHVPSPSASCCEVDDGRWILIGPQKSPMSYAAVAACSSKSPSRTEVSRLGPLHNSTTSGLMKQRHIVGLQNRSRSSVAVERFHNNGPSDINSRRLLRHHSAPDRLSSTRKSSSSSFLSSDGGAYQVPQDAFIPWCDNLGNDISEEFIFNQEEMRTYA